MKTQIETPTKKVPIPKHIYAKLERRAKAEGKTPDEYAEKLCLRAMITTLQPDLCRNCKSAAKIKVMVPECFPLSSCELCEILQSFVEAFSCLKENSVDVPIDASLLAEAKKWNVNIEEATREHFEKVKDDLLLDMICGTSEVHIEGELLKEFEAVKKHLGLKEDAEVIRVLVNERHEQLFPKKA